MSIAPIIPVDAGVTLPSMGFVAPGAANSSFAEMLLGGVEHVSHKLAEADRMASAFALDDSIPLHQVTFALEEARLSVELMMQVRARLVEGYQRVMDMQI